MDTEVSRTTLSLYAQRTRTSIVSRSAPVYLLLIRESTCCDQRGIPTNTHRTHIHTHSHTLSSVELLTFATEALVWREGVASERVLAGSSSRALNAIRRSFIHVSPPQSSSLIATLPHAIIPVNVAKCWTAFFENTSLLRLNEVYSVILCKYLIIIDP